MDLPAQLLASLRSQDLPLPSHNWLAALITARTPPPPLASLIATARARLLASDLTTRDLLDAAYASSRSFPPEAVAGADVREFRLPRDVLVQVLDLEDVSRSRWEQVEELEAIERGEQTRGRQVIRLPVGGEEEDGEGAGSQQQQQQHQQQRSQGPGAVASGAAAAKKATHKLVLQDAKGQKIFGLELKRIEKIAIGTTNIGEKILLKSGTVVARGVIMLEPSTCIFLGGKVDAWQKPWLEGRLTRLRDAVQANGPG